MLIAIDEIKNLISFKYLNADWVLSQYDPTLSVRNIFKSNEERFKEGAEGGSTEFYVTFITISIFTTIGFAIFLAVLSLTAEGRVLAKKQVVDKKKEMVWNGIIMMTFLNYQGLVFGTSSFWKLLALFLYPVAISQFLKENYLELDKPAFRAKYKNLYDGVSVNYRGR